MGSYSSKFSSNVSKVSWKLILVYDMRVMLHIITAANTAHYSKGRSIIFLRNHLWLFIDLCLNATGSEVCKLIWAAARGICNDEIIRLSVQARYSQFPSVGSFTCLSIDHWTQATLWHFVYDTFRQIMFNFNPYR